MGQSHLTSSLCKGQRSLAGPSQPQIYDGLVLHIWQIFKQEPLKFKSVCLVHQMSPTCETRTDLDICFFCFQELFQIPNIQIHDRNN